MKKLRQYDATRGFRIASVHRARRHQHDHRSPARAPGGGDAARRRDGGLRVAARRDRRATRSRRGEEAELARARAGRSCRAKSAPSSSTVSATSARRKSWRARSASPPTPSTAASSRSARSCRRSCARSTARPSPPRFARAAQGERRAPPIRRLPATEGDEVVEARRLLLDDAGRRPRRIWKLRCTHGASVPGCPSGPVMRASRATHRRAPSGDQPASST